MSINVIYFKLPSNIKKSIHNLQIKNKYKIKKNSN